MKNKVTRTVLLLASVVCVVFLAGCVSNIQPASSQDSSKQEIKIGVVKNVVVSLPFYEMQMEKRLESNGYHVTWVYFESPTALSEAFLAGQIQVNGSIGISTLGDLARKGVDSSILYANGYASSAKIYSKTLTRIEQLKGADLGMPPASTETSQIANKLLKEQYHLQAPQDFKVMYTTPLAGATLLQKGDLDALLSYGSDAANIQQLGYHEIFDLSKSWSQYSGGGQLVTSVTITTRSFADSHIQFIEDFTQAYDLAVQKLINNSQEIQHIALQNYDLKKESLPYFIKLAQVQLQGASKNDAVLADAKKILTLFSDGKLPASKIDEMFRK